MCDERAFAHEKLVASDLNPGSDRKRKNEPKNSKMIA
jgi:hypothetical protein